MAMDSLLPISFLLFTFFSVNFVSSNASELSYKDHCASMVSESTPIGIMNDDGFPFGQYHSGYYTGAIMTVRIMGNNVLTAKDSSL
ncbi:hypothetical protein L6164_018450 [Bauhinia variegata]|uniref:Uncharacterized protein n=1 Tax=Bauhinia variegata TaxID=167791 RepID=A0ACB9NCG9_BAUVA|nr:hypothetical protein L6164_018450 [Bauhinia variegata]